MSNQASMSPTRRYEVDVMAYARNLGLAVYSAELPEGVSGMLLKEPAYGSKSGFVIFTEAREPAVRQRFTAAHEIGHFELHKELIGSGVSENYLLRSDGLSSRIEVEANRFAADLLMPFDKIDLAMSEGITSPKDLARAFNVSEIAMAIRLGIPT